MHNVLVINKRFFYLEKPLSNSSITTDVQMKELSRQSIVHDLAPTNEKSLEFVLHCWFFDIKLFKRPIFGYKMSFYDQLAPYPLE